MSDAKPRHTTTLEGIVKALPGRIFRREAMVAIVTLGLGGVGAVWAQSKAKAQVVELATEKVRPVEVKVEALAVDVDALRKELRAKEVRDAQRFDLLYQTILSGRRSSQAEELRQPAVQPADGGQ